VSIGKLTKFAELNTFSNVFQPTFEEVFKKDFKLKGNWNKTFFKNENPITLELGCGRGEYTVGLAQQFPERNFLGIDIKGSRMWSGAGIAIKNQISNVGFLRTRIEMIDSFFAAGEVHEIWITFPDPQLSKSRKRLTSSRFLNLYKSFLDPEGWVNLKTDSEELFDYTYDIAQYNKLETGFSSRDLYSMTEIDDILRIQTYYEKMWLEEGLKIKYIRFKLSGKHVIEKPSEEERT
jgi:tRNA (guanine-N7-)-methyltransferase